MTQQQSIEPAARGWFGFILRCILWRFIIDVFQMPFWQKGVLFSAIAVCGLGWGHRMVHALGGPVAGGNQVSLSTTSGVPADRSFGVSQAPDTLSNPAPWARRVGSSVLLGFIVGWAFRTFVKTMALATAAFVGILGLLSYCNVVNADFTSVQNRYADASGWITHQAVILKDDAMAHVHSGLGGAAGLFIGARRRRL